LTVPLLMKVIVPSPIVPAPVIVLLTLVSDRLAPLSVMTFSPLDDSDILPPPERITLASSSNAALPPMLEP